MLLLWLLGLFLLAILGISLFIGAVRTGLFGQLPDETELLRLETSTAAKILASDGELLGLYYLQNRTHSDLSDLPPYLIEAIIATEDARFYQHHGIDVRGNLLAGAASRASTAAAGSSPSTRAYKGAAAVRTAPRPAPPRPCARHTSRSRVARSRPRRRDRG